MPRISLRKKWVRTDAWRGYFEYDNSVFGGNILAAMGDPYGESQNKEEKQKQKHVASILRKNRIPYRIAYAQTSNVFSRVYDIVVSPKDVKRAKRLISLAKVS